MTIANTIGGRQIDVSPWIANNINSTPMFAGGNLGNYTGGSRLSTSRPGTFTGLLNSWFTAGASVVGGGINAASSVGTSVIGGATQYATQTTANALRTGSSIVHDANETARQLGDNVEGTAKAAAWGIGSYVVLGIAVLIFAGAILYVPPKVLKGGA